MYPGRNPVPSEDKHGKKTGFKKEGEYSFRGQCRAEDIADIA